MFQTHRGNSESWKAAWLTFDLIFWLPLQAPGVRILTCALDSHLNEARGAQEAQETGLRHYGQDLELTHLAQMWCRATTIKRCATTSSSTCVHSYILLPLPLLSKLVPSWTWSPTPSIACKFCTLYQGQIYCAWPGWLRCETQRVSLLQFEPCGLSKGTTRNHKASRSWPSWNIMKSFQNPWLKWHKRPWSGVTSWLREFEYGESWWWLYMIIIIYIIWFKCSILFPSKSSHEVTATMVQLGMLKAQQWNCFGAITIHCSDGSVCTMQDLEHFRGLVRTLGNASSVLCGCGQAFGAQMADDGGTSETKRDVAAATRCIAFLRSLTKARVQFGMRCQDMSRLGSDVLLGRIHDDTNMFFACCRCGLFCSWGNSSVWSCNQMELCAYFWAGGIAGLQWKIVWHRSKLVIMIEIGPIEHASFLKII